MPSKEAVQKILKTVRPERRPHRGRSRRIRFSVHPSTSARCAYAQDERRGGAGIHF